MQNFARRLTLAVSVAMLFVGAAAQSAAATGDNVVAINYNDYHGCALKGDGSLWCWGLNDSGQVGDGTEDDRYTPVRVKSSEGVFLGGVKALARGGYDHTCVLKNDLTVRCWGDNEYGQLGDLTTDDHSFPVAVKIEATSAALAGVKALALGQNHSCAIKKNGTMWCWGLNSNGQLGDGGTDEHHGAVQVMTGSGPLTGVKAIGLGYDHSCAVMEDGTVRCWGRNQFGQLGIGQGDIDIHPLPENVKTVADANFAGVVSVDGGQLHTCALKSAGTLWCWGDNGHSQIGDGTPNEADNPVKVKKTGGTALKGVTSLSTGAFQSCAVTSGAKAWCWGSNANGELALGESVAGADVATRVRASDSTLFADALTITAGDSVTCILKVGKTVFCTGYAEYGQTGHDPSPNPDPDGTYYFPVSVDFP